MPKKLLLLLLLLLLGSYFLFFGGKKEEVKLPSVELQANVDNGEDGYLVSGEGVLNLPEGVEYNVNGSVYIMVNGVKVKSVTVNSKVKGPSTLPLNLPPQGVRDGKVYLGADLTIEVGKKVLYLGEKVPVAFPSKSAILREPSIFVYTKSVDLTDSGYLATLSVTLRNPNPFPISLENPVLSLGGSDYPLPITSLEPSSSSTTEITITSESNEVSGEFRSGVEWSGVKKSVKIPLEVLLPLLPSPEPHFSLEYKVGSIDRNGVKLKATVHVYNPSTLSLNLNTLKLVVEKNDVKKEVTVAEGETIPPGSEKNFNVETPVIPFLVGGSVYLVYNEKKVLSLPLEILPSNFVSPIEVNVYPEEVNQGAYIIHVYLHNPNDFPVDVKNFDVEADYGGSDLTGGFDPQSFELSDSKEVTVGSDTSPLALVPGTVIRVKMEYGLENLSLLFPIKVEYVLS